MAMEADAGRQARWADARATAARERATGTMGPCHMSSDAFHRCDTPPAWYTVTIGVTLGEPEPYRWCRRAVAYAAERAVHEGKSFDARPGLEER